MKTVNYIPRCEPHRAAEDAKPRSRDRGLPKVVDLEVWKAEHQAEPVGPETNVPPVSALGRGGTRGPVRRRSRTALDWAELAVTLAVAAAFIALAARVLFF